MSNKQQSATCSDVIPLMEIELRNRIWAGKLLYLPCLPVEEQISGWAALKEKTDFFYVTRKKVGEPISTNFKLSPQLIWSACTCFYAFVQYWHTQTQSHEQRRTISYRGCLRIDFMESPVQTCPPRHLCRYQGILPFLQCNGILSPHSLEERHRNWTG